jgi:hypothetical protein
MRYRTRGIRHAAQYQIDETAIEQPRSRCYTHVMQPLQPRSIELDCERAGVDIVTTVGVFVPGRLERYRQLGAVQLAVAQLLEIASLQIQMQTSPFVRVKRSARARSVRNFAGQHAVHLAPVHDTTVEKLGIATHYQQGLDLSRAELRMMPTPRPVRRHDNRTQTFSRPLVSPNWKADSKLRTSRRVSTR